MKWIAKVSFNGDICVALMRKWEDARYYSRTSLEDPPTLTLKYCPSKQVVFGDRFSCTEMVWNLLAEIWSFKTSYILKRVSLYMLHVSRCRLHWLSLPDGH